MAETTDHLFAEFSGANTEQWTQKATKDLKGASFEEKLLTGTDLGFDIQPYYGAESMAQTSAIHSLDNATYDPEAYAPRVWWNNVNIEVTSDQAANQTALKALANGAEAIRFELANTDGISVGKLLEGIQFPYCGLSFAIAEGGAAWLQDAVSTLQASEYSIAQWQGIVSAPQVPAKDLAQILAEAPHCRFVYAMAASHQPAHIRIAQLLLHFAKAAEEIGLEAATNRTAFAYQVADQYFLEIASIRALSWLYRSLIQKLGYQGDEKAIIEGITTVKSAAQLGGDAYGNMVSNTTQAMSAVLGGCRYLTVLPHDHSEGQANSFSQRIARNVSSILKEEAYLDRTADPVAGTYFIQQLTQDIAQKAWEWMEKQG